MNFSFKGIDGDPLTTYNFSISFFFFFLNSFVSPSLHFFFVALFVEYFWDINFSFLLEGANIVRR